MSVELPRRAASRVKCATISISLSASTPAATAAARVEDAEAERDSDSRPDGTRVDDAVEGGSDGKRESGSEGTAFARRERELEADTLEWIDRADPAGECETDAGACSSRRELERDEERLRVREVVGETRAERAGEDAAGVDNADAIASAANEPSSSSCCRSSSSSCCDGARSDGSKTGTTLCREETAEDERL